MTRKLRIVMVLVLAASCGGDDEQDDSSTATTVGTTAPGTTAPGTTTPATSGVDPTDDDADGSEAAEESSDSGAPVCSDDADEPNDDQESAVELAEAEDCDLEATAQGDLSGADDVDWLFYRGSDTFGCVVGPNRDVIASGNVRFCKFARCIDGAASVSACPAGTVAAATDAGDPGCCADGLSATNFSIAPECSGDVDDLRVYMRVDRGPEDVCTNYSIRYHF